MNVSIQRDENQCEKTPADLLVLQQKSMSSSAVAYQTKQQVSKAHFQNSEPLRKMKLSQPFKEKSLSVISQEDLNALFDRILETSSVDSVLNETRKELCCHIKDSTLISLEYASHCAIAIAALCAIILFVDEDVLRIIATPPFLLPIIGIMVTGDS